jgi:hypothetical protein
MKLALERFRRHQRGTHCGRGQGVARWGRPAPPTGHPACGPPGQPPLWMSVFHRFLDCIYAVLLSRFDPRVQNWRYPYIYSPVPPPIEPSWNPNLYSPHQDQSQQSREDESSIGSSLISRDRVWGKSLEKWWPIGALSTACTLAEPSST